jgi:phosphohistidine phosphatase SixA
MRSNVRDCASACRSRAPVLAIVALGWISFGALQASAGAEPPVVGARPEASAERPLPGLDAVLGDLRKGGFVVYFRHGATIQAGDGRDADDLSDCATQRNLSPAGRQQAVLIGAAFKALAIPVGTVATSPFCRCKDTAQLAFDRFTVDNDLYFAISTDAQTTKRLADALRFKLSTPPPAGSNSVIVAHTANLREAVGIWPKPNGVAYVFRPLKQGRFEVLAKILPQEWIKAAKLD